MLYIRHNPAESTPSAQQLSTLITYAYYRHNSTSNDASCNYGRVQRDCENSKQSRDATVTLERSGARPEQSLVTARLSGGVCRLDLQDEF